MLYLLYSVDLELICNISEVLQISKYHLLFTHSSVNRHLGCVHVLTILSSAEVYNVIHVSLSILVSFILVCLPVGLLGQMLVIFLVF